MKYEPATEFATYSQVPFHRRRWFYILSFFFFMPVTILILLTGDVYLEHEGAVKKLMTPRNRVTVACAFTVLIVTQIARLLLA